MASDFLCTCKACSAYFRKVGEGIQGFGFPSRWMRKKWITNITAADAQKSTRVGYTFSIIVTSFPKPVIFDLVRLGFIFLGGAKLGLYATKAHSRLNFISFRTHLNGTAGRALPRPSSWGGNTRPKPVAKTVAKQRPKNNAKKCNKTSKSKQQQVQSKRPGQAGKQGQYNRCNRCKAGQGQVQ
jgi:hypothetical protein